MSEDGYARAIIAEGQRRGITPRGIQIALATVFVESNFIMYANESDPPSEMFFHEAQSTDANSDGLFQQRAPWWGTAAQRMDATASAGMFYDHLVKYDYNNTAFSPGTFAQDVQGSAFPDRYDQYMGAAIALYTRLQGAPAGEGKQMTLYGVDVSNNNDGGRGTIDLNEIVIENFSWIEAKVSEGNYYSDPDWKRIKAFGAAKGVPVIGYHYVTNNDPASQVRKWLDNDGGPNVMLDFEKVPDLTYIGQFWAVVNAFKARGVTTRLSYIPHWYWQNIGSPDISNVPGLIASNYVTGTGYASSLYPGDNSNRWFSYGGATPQILQFSSQAVVANLQTCDVNAYRGTLEQLYELLGLEAPKPTGVFMALTDAQQDQLLAAVLDIQTQLRGPGLKGWPQLGQNDAGQNLTEVDALAKVEEEVEQIAKGAK